MLQRPTYLKQLIQFKDTDFIKIITGVRRAGKSVLLSLFKDYLLQENVSEDHIIYMNFERFDYQTIKTEAQFRDKLMELLPKDNQKVYLLLDEIQVVTGWQRVVNGIRVSFNSDITITGSNANMLSGELATLLSGRYIEIPVYPFSFQEFLSAKGIEAASRQVDNAYDVYEKYGGFPSVVIADESIKDTILSGIFDTIVLNDVALRAGLKDPTALKSIISFLSDNVGQLVNASKIVNTLKSEGVTTSVHTVNRYLDLLEAGYLFYRAKQYDIRGRDYLRTNGKYFMIDAGLRRNAVGRKDGNYGNRLENIVFIELKRRGYTVDVGRLDRKEIDFIARKRDETLYLQVAYELPPNTHETDNLLAIKDNYKKIVITGRYYDVEQIDGIPIIYIVDWLLGA
ncbi:MULTISPECIES: ATP-binding protein [Pseudolactococcus]|uniref:AAA superfamily ATPase n=1 Tax=Pseudolactococcus piscium MKFS47 TaxID=297352 RepID=A0A0D6DUV5_9LACT|nr:MULTISPECIES: ATP-binding protein [Lactococcus]MDN5447281.1 ATP-binding protein [Lactococcus lactis]MCJ1971888.1 ATP-binding protein [Lactococcus carnosus]MCJ1979840.1 ATP-binding protein [Lactococcus carnosus]MCJ1991155.1 ATP-binding protein [Lactococcus carnosus]CEN27712.1 AAA superfamily ATPase [Lactococcus piscium MKFS47]